MPSQYHDREGRLEQSFKFAMDTLVGRRILAIDGFCCRSRPIGGGRVDLMVFRFEGTAFAHTFFLDAGLGFWEVRTYECVLFDWGDDDCEQQDLAARYGLRGARMLDAECLDVRVDRDPKDPEHGMAELIWRTSSGELRLFYTDQADDESLTMLKLPRQLDARRCSMRRAR